MIYTHKSKHNYENLKNKNSFKINYKSFIDQWLWSSSSSFSSSFISSPYFFFSFYNFYSASLCFSFSFSSLSSSSYPLPNKFPIRDSSNYYFFILFYFFIIKWYIYIIILILKRILYILFICTIFIFKNKIITFDSSLSFYFLIFVANFENSERAFAWYCISLFTMCL